jgi:hypothetical protein
MSLVPALPKNGAFSYERGTPVPGESQSMGGLLAPRSWPFSGVFVVLKRVRPILVHPQEGRAEAFDASMKEWLPRRYRGTSRAHKKHPPPSDHHSSLGIRLL